MNRRTPPRALPGRHPSSAAREETAFGEAFGQPVNELDRALRELAVTEIVPNADQPRKRFESGALEALTASVRERGVLQPVLVRRLGDGRYQLIAGERRWRAARLVGLERIPAFVRRDTDDAAALELALIENAAREDLSPVEVARTLSTLINDLGLTQAVLARRIGRSRSDVANTLRLLGLPNDVLDLIDDGRLSKGHGKSLLGVPDATRRSALAQRAVNAGWSVRQLEREVARAVRPGPRASREPALTDAAGELTARAEATVGYPVTVQRHGQGFAIRVLVDGREDAESVLERLRGPAVDATTSSDTS